MTPELSVCIVSWNTRDLLDECLDSIREAADAVSREVIVVDNASSDGSADMVRAGHPEVTLIANDENVGYAAANNQAIERASGNYVLLLNPDIVVHPGALDALANALDRRSQAGAVAPRLILPDGSVQASCRNFPTPDVVLYEALGFSRLFPRSRVFGKYRMTWWNYDEERTVDQPMASALLLRGEAIAEVGGMDESFPMFFNDVDLCKRLWDADWEVWFTPRASMDHVGGAATAQARRRMLIESHRSFVRFYEKHYRGRLPRWQYLAALMLLGMGYRVRLALLSLRGEGGSGR
ncbi:MAG: glycosyltransferase family 2 protein [Armatimonadota bacterium]|nr:glycosyltransferase family 2 protein [Armatimonadota bacterium]